MYKISLGHAGSPYEWWPMPLDNSGTKMVLNRYGNLITTKDRTRKAAKYCPKVAIKVAINGDLPPLTVI